MPTRLLSSASFDVTGAPGRRSRVWGAFLLLSVLACERTQPSVGGDSVTDTTPTVVVPIDSQAITETTGWEWDAGAYIVLPTVDGGVTAGSLLRPGVDGQQIGDTVGLGRIVQPRRVELFSRAGKVGEADISVEPSQRVDSTCAMWPTARLQFPSGQTAPGWTVAFAEGRVLPIPLDSIEGMTARDSARLAANLARIASALRDDTVATFRGLPFVVLRAYRAQLPDSAFVVAMLIRRVSQEDAPKEERLVMVVDVSHADPRRWSASWWERASGIEDELLVAEPLLAFRARGADDVRLLFGRDDGMVLSAAVLTRIAGKWMLQWESPIC